MESPYPRPTLVKANHPIWTRVAGTLSLFPGLYFWASGLAYEVWHWSFRWPSTLTVVLSILAAVPVSAAVAYCGSRWWYLATAFEAATFLFIGLRMH
jgi:hypothetical protein